MRVPACCCNNLPSSPPLLYFLRLFEFGGGSIRSRSCPGIPDVWHCDPRVEGFSQLRTGLRTAGILAAVWLCHVGNKATAKRLVSTVESPTFCLLIQRHCMFFSLGVFRLDRISSEFRDVVFLQNASGFFLLFLCMCVLLLND